MIFSQIEIKKSFCEHKHLSSKFLCIHTIPKQNNSVLSLGILWLWAVKVLSSTTGFSEEFSEEFL